MPPREKEREVPVNAILLTKSVKKILPRGVEDDGEGRR